jgi:hypothetical protein
MPEDCEEPLKVIFSQSIVGGGGHLYVELKRDRPTTIKVKSKYVCCNMEGIFLFPIT